MSSSRLGVTAVMLPELDFDAQIELCRSLGIRYYQYRPRVIPESSRGQPFGDPWGNHRFDLTPRSLLRDGEKLTRQLRAAGMEPWGTVPALNIESDDEEIRVNCQAAAAAGAMSVRCNPPPYPKQAFEYHQFLDRVLSAYERVIHEISGPLKIKLVLETHANSLAASPGLAWNIVHHFMPQQIGVIFDLSNFNREGEINPILAVSVLKDYIDCIHVGGSRRATSPDGPDAFGARRVVNQFCPLQDSDVNIPTWLAALRDAGVGVPLIIEDFDSRLTGPQRLTRCAVFLHAVEAKSQT